MFTFVITAIMTSDSISVSVLLMEKSLQRNEKETDLSWSSAATAKNICVAVMKCTKHTLLYQKML